ncbi:E3 ubiquitin-protein ligase TRAIP isoform X3 [Brassica rapa]|uniref:E3 ubiquitin-protein ligase TRAIP isoform X3 n=1 Tax=Brassica campestris TaxID=3711 RepID=UPI00087277AE|nr:E3 ubiquitin-protein ligase TRAIP isoform X3 [Brassica rapa]XP_018510086.1 E3 ubiquitin-protein ligase TRAIP isoform X3 [Brassica rapa]XP_033135211.1 E3 ubiquitin-protein ligase TRAIP isoform X3 [Brassica rapa]
MAGENAAASAICSICYEDLKPAAENLQSISACGHVFHELCLQQWFEYCPSTNKRNCPICKQKCYLKDPFRLYFQSSGNQIESQKVGGIEEDPVVLRGEVKRLEGKLQNLSSALEEQKKVNVEVSDQLYQCKEKLKEDKVKRVEAMQEVSTNQRLLKLKSEECVQLTSKCTQLQDRTMALAKELASLKLVSDLSLEEDDVLKLALLGNNAKTKDTIDTLVKSLVIRNRSYKELLAKRNQLGRGEARSSEKLEKALEKMDKLKKRVRELEMITEERDNKAIRDMIKASKNCSDREVSKPATESLDKISKPLGKLEKNDGFSNHGSCFSGREDSFFGIRESVIEVDDDVHEATLSGIRHSDSTMKDEKVEDSNVQERRDDPVIKDIKFNIREGSTPSDSPCNNELNAGAGGSWLSSGENQNLRRWSKQGDRNKSPHSLGGSVSGKDDLISVGPDGKGGRIKVLRSKPQFSNANASSGSGKRLRTGTKTSGTSSQGCLQIEHFFGKPKR